MKLKVICVIKDDVALNYLETHEAEEIHIRMADEIKIVYSIKDIVGVTIRDQGEVIPIEEYRNQQIDKVIES